MSRLDFAADVVSVLLHASSLAGYGSWIPRFGSRRGQVVSQEGGVGVRRNHDGGCGCWHIGRIRSWSDEVVVVAGVLTRR